MWRSDSASQCYIKSEAGKQGQHNLQHVTLQHLFLALGFDCHLMFCTFFFLYRLHCLNNISRVLASLAAVVYLMKAWVGRPIVLRRLKCDPVTTNSSEVYIPYRFVFFSSLFILCSINNLLHRLSGFHIQAVYAKRKD